MKKKLLKTLKRLKLQKTQSKIYFKKNMKYKFKLKRLRLVRKRREGKEKNSNLVILNDRRQIPKTHQMKGNNN